MQPQVRRNWLGVWLCLATALAYAPVFRAGFAWDDDRVVYDNPLIRAADGLQRFWLTTQPTDYWPVASSTLWVEWRLWGMHAAGYHLVNVALHAVACLLLWAILGRLRVPGAYWAALIFAVHPVNVESVAWITQRKGLLAMVFFLGSIRAFLESDDFSPRPHGRGYGASEVAAPVRAWTGSYLLSLFCFILALLSKGSVAALPFVLLGLIAWRRRPNAGDLARLAPFFAVAAALAAVDIWFQHHGSPEIIRQAGPIERLLGAATAVWFYLAKALCPVNLTFVYPRWSLAPTQAAAWLPLLAFGVLALSVAAPVRAWRPARYACAYFCLMLLPVLGFIDVYYMRYTLVADHYEHTALIGIIVLVTASWFAWEGIQDTSRQALALALVVVLGCLTWHQSEIYHDDLRLFSATVARNPQSWMAQNALGAALLEAGRPEEAATSIEQALRLNPNYAEAWFNLGCARSQLGQSDAARADFRRSLALKPKYFEARFNLAIELANAGQTAEAVGQYEEALEIDPFSFAAQCNLGNALLKLGRAAEAVPHFERALQLNPTSVGVRNSLELARGRAGGRRPPGDGSLDPSLRRPEVGGHLTERAP